MGFFEKLFHKREDRLYAPVSGRIVPLTQVPDPIFAQKLLGDGVAIEPAEGCLRAPCDATVDRIFETGHAVLLTADCGAELLIHAGLDTVNLGGKPFRVCCANGDKVKRGDVLLRMDLEAIRAAGYVALTPMVVANSGEYSGFHALAAGQVTTDDPVIRLTD